MNRVITLHYRTGYKLIKEGLSDNALAIYISLRSLYNPNMEKQVINCDMLYYQLYNKLINKSNSSRERKIIKDALNELASTNHITIINEENNQFIIDLSNISDTTTIAVEMDERDPFTGKHTGTKIENKSNYYIKLELEQLQKVLSDNSNNKKIFRYLFHYLNLKAQNDMYYFMMTRQEIADVTKIDVRTADEYNKILQDNNIIHVVHYTDYKYSDTKRTVNNLYGLYENIDKLEDAKEKFIKEKLEDGTIYMSKAYANKGSKTKEFKEELARQKEENIETTESVENIEIVNQIEEVTPVVEEETQVYKECEPSRVFKEITFDDEVTPIVEEPQVYKEYRSENIRKEITFDDEEVPNLVEEKILSLQKESMKEYDPFE